MGLLASGCRAAAFRTASLMRAEEVEPFAPGQLAQPVAMPDVNQYQPQGAWTAGRRAQAQREAQARYQHDVQAAQAAEAQRLQQLAAYQRQYDDWAGAQRAEIRRHNVGIAELAAALRAGEPDTVVEYFSAALYASTAWPEGLPRQVVAAFDPAARQLVLNWELPGYDIVPAVKYVRYLPSVDQDKESPRPAAQRSRGWGPTATRSRERPGCPGVGHREPRTVHDEIHDHRAPSSPMPLRRVRRRDAVPDGRGRPGPRVATAPRARERAAR